MWFPLFLLRALLVFDPALVVLSAGFFVSQFLFTGSDFLQSFASEFVRAFVFGMTRVTFYPVPLDVMLGSKFIELFPKVFVLDRFLGGGFPSVAFPAVYPFGDADLFPDNVFFLSDKLSGLIDFYFACNDALAYDVAICLNAWCFERDFAFNITKGRALIKGYERMRPLSKPERDALPILARGAAMRFLLTRCFDWLNRPQDAVVIPHDPIDYIMRLRFHETATSISDYGHQS